VFHQKISTEKPHSNLLTAQIQSKAAQIRFTVVEFNSSDIFRQASIPGKDGGNSQ
jgi:hypothetical protein